MVGHALVRQQEAMLNSLESMIANVVKEMMKGDYVATGPQLGISAAEKGFYTDHYVPCSSRPL